LTGGIFFNEEALSIIFIVSTVILVIFIFIYVLYQTTICSTVITYLTAKNAMFYAKVAKKTLATLAVLLRSLRLGNCIIWIITSFHSN